MCKGWQETAASLIIVKACLLSETNTYTVCLATRQEVSENRGKIFKAIIVLRLLRKLAADLKNNTYQKAPLSKGGCCSYNSSR